MLSQTSALSCIFDCGEIFSSGRKPTDKQTKQKLIECFPDVRVELYFLTVGKYCQADVNLQTNKNQSNVFVDVRVELYFWL